MDDDERELLIAFAHNSCKKISQLGHVLVLLTDARLDRYAGERQLFLCQDQNCEAITKKYTNGNKRIYKQLVQFRKKCIQEASDYYGQRFLAMKTSFQNEESAKAAKVREIESECKNQIDIIQQIVPYIGKLTESANKLSLTELQNDVGQAKENSQQMNGLNSKLRKLLNDCDQIQNESQNRIKNMVDEHKTIARVYKKKIKDVKKQKYKNTLLKFKERLSQVSDTVNSIRQIMASHLQNKKKILSPFYKKLQETMQDLQNQLPKKDLSIEFLNTDKDFRLMKSKLDDLHQTNQIQFSDEMTEIERQRNEMLNDFNNKIHQKQQDLNTQSFALQSENEQFVRNLTQREQAFSSACNAENEAVDDIIQFRKSFLQKANEFFGNYVNQLSKIQSRTVSSVDLDENEEKFENFKNDLEKALQMREKLIDDAINMPEEKDSDYEEEEEEENEDLEEKNFRKKEKYEQIYQEKEKENNLQVDKMLKQCKTEQTNRKNNHNKEIEHKLLISKSKLAEDKQMKDKEIEQHREEVIAKLKSQPIPEEDENENLNEEEQEEEEELTEEQKLKYYNQQKSAMQKELKSMDNEIQNFMNENQKLIRTLDKQLKDQLEAKKSFVQNRGPSKVLSELIQQINNDEKSFLSSMQFKSRDQLDIMLQKLITAQISGESAVFISELSLMKKHEENTSQIVDTELALELKMSESPIAVIDKKYDSQMTSLMQILKGRKEKLDTKKSSLKSKYRVKDSPFLNETREMDLKISVFTQKNEDQLDKLKEDYAKKKEQLITKHEAMKKSILSQIDQEKAKQQALIENNEKEVEEYLSQIAEKEIIRPPPKKLTFADQIVKVSQKETDLMMKYLSPNGNPQISNVQNKIKNIQHEIETFLSNDNLTSFDINEIGSRKPQKSSRGGRKSNLNVLPPLQPL
ncbi:hypothetical protein TVAG_205450 [Trichomonas vaginalis G3]|uniref:Uncharacterized protein n=1 Tax=Trichomonas vaginalis (strain ATCC PRA-98 / G3) TaxID=412133 RepID=A2FFS4_TRIV3|nr:hypothetical protein TVAGG3_0488850 [Trichomonas vaginalis G3]EAX96258.1 hypothetical protein TVAG_205450 [Trichomonas vaginalis G3]KAI5516233.1 hypothetical protein TVAGG3_0488850 [Trichomonas vaginalis G3]|eukprot:XP_001309188.1 hypothetical protein [Trichomonas vaginalis G3]